MKDEKPNGADAAAVVTAGSIAPNGATARRSGHTPGPWIVEVGERHLYHAHSRRLILSRHSDGSTCTLAKLPESYGGDYESAEANARVMAAAPDMLTALRVAAAAINPSDIHGISLCEWNDRLRAATVTINSALKKAEGK